MKYFYKIINIVFSITLLILAGSLIASLYAQVPPVLPASPTAPVGKIPWGHPSIYLGIIFIYGLLRMHRSKKDI